MVSSGSSGQIAITVRAFLQQHWGEWHANWGPPAPITPSQWTCMRSATFLAYALENAGFAARVASGRPAASPNTFGFWTGDRWEDHAWVVCGDYIIDITADQFGLPEVMTVPASDRRYRAGHSAETTLALTQNGLRAVQALKTLWC